MRTDGAIITNAGQELLSYALANNKQVNFTKVKLGKGDVNTFDEAKKLTDVVSFYKQIPITSIARNNAGIVRIRSSFTNADFPLQVVLKEIGVFAVVEGKSEVLFGYVNDGEGESFPPGSSGNIVERVRDIYVGISTNTQVTAVIDRSVVYATIYDLDEEIAKCAKKITRVNPGNGIHGGGTLGEDITVSIKSNDTSINLDAANGITLKKTTSWLNDAAQLFTAKGALNLFNTLTTNFTDAINTAKQSLRLDIAKKLNKGAYLGDAQDLKNDIDSKEPIINKNSGFNKVKTDSVENDTNKVFSAKGAFDLKNWLVTNYTTLMNNIKSVLDNDIAAKLPHGGYNRTAQDLKNDVDTKVSKDGDIIKKLGSYDFKRLVVPEIVGIDINQGTTTAINTIAVEITNGWKASMLSFDLIVRAYTGSNCDTTIRFNGYTYSTNKTWVNTRAYIIGYRHNGVKVYTTTHSNGNPLIYFNFNGYLDYCNCMISNILESVPNTYKIYSIQGATGDLVPTSYMYSTTFKPTPKDINAVNIAGDAMTGVLSLPRLRTTTDEGTLISRLDKDFIGYSSQRGAYIGGVSSTGVSRFFYSGSDTSRPCIRIGSNYYSLYHEGLKPNLEDVGATNFGLGSSATQKNPKNEKFGGFWRDTNLNSSGITMPYDGTPIINFFRVNRSNQIPYTGTSTNGSEITWNKIYSENSKPTTSELGAVSKSGDTMSGVLSIRRSGPTSLILDRLNTKDSNNNINFKYTDASYYFGFVRGSLRVGESEDLSSGHSIYHTGFKPTPSELGAVGKSGDTMTGQLLINSSPDAQLIVRARTNEKPNYILGQNANGASIFFIGKGSSGIDDITMHSYVHNNSIILRSDRVEAKKNLYVGNALVYHTGNINTYCPHRVGDIIESTNTEHPATTFIGTQWERYGDGKVIVGLSSSETEFNSVGKTGGTKTESLTEAQNGPHGHTVTSVISGSGWYGQGGALGGMGAIKTTSSGTGAPHNNLQPYIVAYRWRRIA